MSREVNFEQIPGVAFLETQVSNDERGSFTKIVKNESINNNLIQGLKNVALSKNSVSGTIRGLHFQTQPFAEDKAVFCITGSIFDVIVDLRKDSPTAGRWAAIDLSGEIPLGIFIPRGCAHGFQTNVDHTEVLYLISSSFSESNSFSLNAKEIALDIPWPRKISNISYRDSNGIDLSQALKLMSSTKFFLNTGEFD